MVPQRTGLSAFFAGISNILPGISVIKNPPYRCLHDLEKLFPNVFLFVMEKGVRGFGASPTLFSSFPLSVSGENPNRR
jgi:hypothetical protein